MPIEFKKKIAYSRFLDASSNFELREVLLEYRADPLTGRVTTIFDIPTRRYVLPKTDLQPLVQRSVEMGCPFCPERLDTATPKYPPELFPQGRFVQGEICILPNNASFAPYSGVAVMGSQHFRELGSFPQELLVRALKACQGFFQRVVEYDPRIRYSCINWNYLPPSGGSLIHPHLQPVADYFPVNSLKEMLSSSRRYLRRNGSPFWLDLINKERELGERYLGNIGGINWLLSFAPWGRALDVMAIFPGPTPLPRLSPSDIEGFAQGLCRVLKYFADQNYYSFNMTLFSCANELEYFWPHARIVPRLSYPGLGTSDCSYMEVLQNHVHTASFAEQAKPVLKAYFG